MNKWLGGLPTRWREARLDHVARAWTSNVDKHSVEGQQAVRLCNYTDVYKNASITDQLTFMAATATTEQVERFRLVVGDTVITKDSETADDIGIPAFVAYEAPDLVCGYHLAIVRPDPAAVAPRYLYWVMASEPTLRQWAVLASGVTRVGIRGGDLAKAAIPLPPIPEQREIADFLDRETARIDTLIAKQEQLITTLHELRASVIRSALLGKLDHSRQLTPSGVETLGDVPASWTMSRVRYLCTLTTGGEDSGNATEDGQYPFFVRGREVLRSNHYSFDGEAVMTPGDGQGGTGKVFHHINGRFEAHQRVYVFTDFKGVSGWYFYYYLSTFLRDIALAGSNTVTMESLRRPLLAGFRVALPPVSEQQRITAHLDEQTARIDALIAKSEEFIELSKERRSALITAAVTGQLDVRGEVA